MKPSVFLLNVGAFAIALIASLSLKASHRFGTGNLWCRITIFGNPQCNLCLTAHTGIGTQLPSTQCTVISGTFCTKSTCAQGSTWRTGNHTNYNGRVKKTVL